MAIEIDLVDGHVVFRSGERRPVAVAITDDDAPPPPERVPVGVIKHVVDDDGEHVWVTVGSGTYYHPLATGGAVQVPMPATANMFWYTSPTAPPQPAYQVGDRVEWRLNDAATWAPGYVVASVPPLVHVALVITGTIVATLDASDAKLLRPAPAPRVPHSGAYPSAFATAAPQRYVADDEVTRVTRPTARVEGSNATCRHCGGPAYHGLNGSECMRRGSTCPR